ncbi:hypothetical protein C3495_03975 [Clostridiaceae bacterium 14S0207]|nr:hypothetical protein C3495_03975 [Clostridiaceae bacterium 14S0207]
MKKKIISILCIFMLIFSLNIAVGCSGKNETNKKETNTEVKKEKNNTVKEENKEKIKIGTLKGPTGISMVKLMDEQNNKYDIRIFDSPDQIVAKIVNGELDGAAVPSNLAAVLYNKTKGNVKLACVNTLGMLYVVENGDTIKNIGDLKGKTIYSSGKGATPEYILHYILAKNNIDKEKDIDIQYMNQHSDLSAALASKKANIAILPEPFVTVTKVKDKNLKVSLDLTKEWEKVSDKNSKLAMGIIVFRKNFIDKNEKNLDKFLEDYKNSIEFVNNNTVKAAELTEKYGIIAKAKIAEKAIPKCNIVFLNAQESKEHLNNFYDVLLKNNPKSIGGKLPNEDFYYKGK